MDQASQAWDTVDDVGDSTFDGLQDMLGSAPGPARPGTTPLEEQVETWQRFKDQYDSRPFADWDDQASRDVRDAQARDPGVPAPALPSAPQPDPRAPDTPAVEELDDTAYDAVSQLLTRPSEERPAANTRTVTPSAGLLAPLLMLLDEGAQRVEAAARTTVSAVESLLLVLMGLVGGLLGIGGAAGSAAASAKLVAAQATTPRGATLLGAFALAATGLLAPRARRWWLPLLAPLLSRITPDRIMEHEARKEIFEIVRGEPGISLNGIVGKLGLSRNAVAYHLAVFEGEKTIVSVKDGKYRRYFQNGGKYVNGAKDVVATLRNEKTLRVARFVLLNPGAIQKELCAAVGTSPSATNWHVARLERVNLIRKSRVANTVRYHAGEALLKYDLSEFGLTADGLAGAHAVDPTAPPSAAPLAL